MTLLSILVGRTAARATTQQTHNCADHSAELHAVLRPRAAAVTLGGEGRMETRGR